MTQTSQVLCGYCRVPLKGPPEPNPDDRYACPICGEGDRFEVVMNEVAEYVAEVARLKGSAEIVPEIDSTHLPSSRRWRFIVDVES